jgi:hypothetical protein
MQAYRIHQSEERIADLFRATFPNVPMVAPIAQVRRQLDQLREVHGFSRSDDVLTLLAAVADVLGAQGHEAVRELSFADHRLTVVLEATLAPRLGDFRQALSELGYQVRAETTAQNLPSLAIEPSKTK